MVSLSMVLQMAKFCAKDPHSAAEDFGAAEDFKDSFESVWEEDLVAPIRVGEEAWKK